MDMLDWRPTAEPDLALVPACDLPGTPFRRWTKAARPKYKSYVDREPSLEDLLAEPIVRSLMCRDGVTDDAVRAALRGKLPKIA